VLIVSDLLAGKGKEWDPATSCSFAGESMLARIGHHIGVAMVFGIKFSGFLAWWMWRTIYLLKLPSLAKKLRLMMDWTLNLLFGTEIEQMIMFSDVEGPTERIARIQARRRQGSPVKSSQPATNYDETI
jgi:hypothetical protein